MGVMSGGEGGSGASDHSHATLGGKEKQKKGPAPQRGRGHCRGGQPAARQMKGLLTHRIRKPQKEFGAWERVTGVGTSGSGAGVGRKRKQGGRRGKKEGEYGADYR